MSKTKDAYDDAMSATCHDESYVKGFWRLGQASMALKRTEEALIAYEKASALDIENKALKKECENAKKRLEVEKKEAEEEEARKAEEKEAAKNGESKSSSLYVPAVKPKTTMPSASTSKTITTEEKKEISSGDFSKSDHVRGYKIVNGKKTSFFHHEQTEEEKRLIGDITPKRIDATQEPAQQTGPMKIEDKGTSLWNKAGTWEEKDVTDWAIQSLKEKVSQCEYDLPEGSPDPNAHAKVTNITKLISSKDAGGTCHASVAAVRGKKKFIFEFTLCVKWEVTLGDGRNCKGEMTFLDVDGTHEIGEGYDLSDYNVDSDTPSDAKYLLERFVRDGGLRSVIEKAMDEWIGLFRDTYS
jgi:tetratricopeptide (TPR) repeat protein